MNEIAMVLSRLATGALAAAVWQGLLLAGAVALGFRLLPETPARVRFAIWFAVFALIAGLPFTSLWPGPARSASAAVPAHAWLTLNDRWCFWIAAIWAAASLARAVSLAVAAHRVRGLWKRARPVQLIRPDLLSTGRKLELCVSDEVDRPAVIGFFSPRIVMPQWLLDRMSAAELDQVVLHEAGHLSRRDDWLNLLQKLALVLFPLNPALAWIERRLCLERELACDERVLRATGAPVAYAECLARIAEYRLERRSLRSGLALALAAIGRESELSRRVLSLLSSRKSMKRAHVRLVFGSAMALLTCAAAAFERTPQLVAFSSTSPLASAQASSNVQAVPALSGFRAVAVRAAALPAPQWKTVGDAPPRFAAKPLRYAKATKASAPPRFAYARAAQANMTGPEENAYQPRMVQVVQTVASSREISAAEDIVVASWVTTSPASDSGDANFSAPSEDRAASPREIRRFAAVPVQGGWLVFQL